MPKIWVQIRDKHKKPLPGVAVSFTSDTCKSKLYCDSSQTNSNGWVSSYSSTSAFDGRCLPDTEPSRRLPPGARENCSMPGTREGFRAEPRLDCSSLFVLSDRDIVRRAGHAKLYFWSVMPHGKIGKRKLYQEGIEEE
jgi:hypothetical protein